MVTFWIALFVLAIALTVCIGGLIILFRQKIVVNEKGEVTSVEIPLLGKLKKNYPSLAEIFFGVFLAAFVWNKWTIELESENMPLVAKINLEHASPNARKDVFVGVIPQKYHVFENGILPNTTHDIAITVEKSADYQVVVYTVVGIDTDGRTQRAVEHGRVKIIGDFERGEFAATLRAQ
jgi:hypothetical protein